VSEILRAGEVVVITSGDYSDYGMVGFVRVLRDFDVETAYREFRSSSYNRWHSGSHCDRCRKPEADHPRRTYVWTGGDGKVRQRENEAMCGDLPVRNEWDDQIFVGNLVRSGLVEDIPHRNVHEGGVR
jgi:hypothetical protein